MNIIFEFSFKDNKSKAYLDRFADKFCRTFSYTDHGIDYSLHCQRFTACEPEGKVLLTIAVVCNYCCLDVSEVDACSQIFNYIDLIEQMYPSVYSKIWSTVDNPELYREALRKSVKEMNSNPFPQLI